MAQLRQKLSSIKINQSINVIDIGLYILTNIMLFDDS